MKTGNSWKTKKIILAALVAGSVSGSIAFAQGSEGFGGPGGPPPRHGRGMPPFGSPRRVTVLDLPMPVLSAGLKLTEDQQSKVHDIQKSFRDQRDSLMPRRGPDSGGPPDQSTMQANMEKLKALDAAANNSIKAVLNADQKALLPDLLKNIETLRAAGIPAELYGKLNLSDGQTKKIAEIAQQAQQDMHAKMEAARQSGDFEATRSAMDQSRAETHQKAMAILTDDQKSMVEQFIKDHPRPQGGRGGGPGRGHGGPPHDGFGPPPGGGPDGGPPPPDGPPPGGDPSNS